MKNYIVEQKITAFVNRYEVYEVRSDGEKGELAAFVEQKRLAFKEEIIFYTNSAKTDEAFRVKAEKVMDVHGKFMVTDTKGTVIGAVRKSFKSSLFRSTWELFSADDLRLIVRESNKKIAIIRRLWAFIPYIGDFPFFVKYHFDFVEPSSDRVIARYLKTTRLRDNYRLQIDDGSILDSIGWQTIVAQCVLLDALQGR